MKFGKRLAAEAARRWRPYYLDYKACKRAIQHDVSCRGAACQACQAMEMPTCTQLACQASVQAYSLTPECCNGWSLLEIGLDGLTLEHAQMQAGTSLILC